MTEQNARVRRRAMTNGAILTIVVALGTFGFAAAVIPLSGVIANGLSLPERRLVAIAALLAAAIVVARHFLKVERPTRDR